MLGAKLLEVLPHVNAVFATATVLVQQCVEATYSFVLAFTLYYHSVMSYL